MSAKIAADHLARSAVVYVRQSTMTQVLGNLESQKRQYALADAARAAGFVSVTVIDDDLGRSGSGLATRPGFQRLVAELCAGAVGAVFCIEASRLARNGRDWHHLVDLCALTGALVIDPDGVYDPRLMNDRLLLGLKGTMSEYELSLLRQRGPPPGTARPAAARSASRCRRAWSGARTGASSWMRTSGFRVPSSSSSPSSRSSAARGRSSCGSAMPPCSCPSSGATASSAGSSGASRPTTASCRCCTIRSMPAPMHSAAVAGGRVLSMGAP
jgi:Resolvase, N terminal domain